MPSIAESILSKKLLPTALDSREIREQWSQRLREQALFSAKMTLKGYLERLQGVLAAVADGRLDESAARLVLRAKLAELGYAAPGEGLKDAASAQRLNLILKTNRQTAGSLAQIARSQDPVMLLRFPAWELVVGGYRRTHRKDWAERWQAAGQAVGWKGAHRTRMAALKNSPIWKALGDGAGGFRDTLGNPYPPFAFGSSYEWSELSLTETQDLGLLPKAEGLGKPVANTAVANSAALPDDAVANGEHCQDCGEWLNGDGTCTGCQGADEAVAKGQNPDKASVQAAEVGKGKAALKKCLKEKVDVYDALARSDLGTISLIYGDERRGIAHFAQRKDALDHLPHTLIYGTLGGEYQKGDKRNITYGGYTAVLRLQHDNKEERWVVTAFGPNDKKEGSPR